MNLGMILHKWGCHVRTLYCEARRDFILRTEGRVAKYGNKKMPTWDGGTDSNGREHKPIWPKIAKFLITNRYSPEQFIKAQFAGKLRNPPQPNHLMGQTAVEKYHEYCDNRAEVGELTSDLTSYQQRTLMEMKVKHHSLGYDPRTAWYLVAADQTMGVPLIFRYCVAVSMGFDDLASVMHEAALMEYLSNHQNYNDAWGEAIPESLKAEADQLYTDLEEARSAYRSRVGEGVYL